MRASLCPYNRTRACLAYKTHSRRSIIRNFTKEFYFDFIRDYVYRIL